MSSQRAPLHFARISSLLMAWIFGVLGGSFGLNALIKSNQQKSMLKRVAKPTVVNINTNDITHAGIASTIACALIGILASTFLLAALIRKLTRRSSLKLETFALAFATIYLFASLVAFTDFYANRSAKISATLGSLIIPEQIIDQTAKALGQTRIYKDINYLRWTTYIQWFTVLFAAIATVITFIAASRARSHHTDVTGSPNSSVGLTAPEKEKNFA